MADDGVGDAQAMQVAHDTLESLSTDIIGKDHSSVLHQLSCGQERGALGLTLATYPPAQSLQANSPLLIQPVRWGPHPPTGLPLLLTSFLALHTKLLSFLSFSK